MQGGDADRLAGARMSRASALVLCAIACDCGAVGVRSAQLPSYINSGYASPLVLVTSELSRQINGLRGRPDDVKLYVCLRDRRQHPNTRFSNSFGYVRCLWDPHWCFPYGPCPMSARAL